MKKEYRNAAKSKNAIRSALIELLGEKRNISSISIGELAERADIAKSTFYNHYSDIYAVIEELQNEFLGKLEEIFLEMQYDTKSSYKSYLRLIICFLSDNEDTFRKMIKSTDSEFFLEKLKTIISKKVFENNVPFPFSNDPTERYIQVRFFTNACVDTLSDYFDGRISSPIDLTGETIINILDNYNK